MPVETATYRTDQVVDLCATLRYLGVSLHKESYMFGDNQSVVTNATIPHSQLRNAIIVYSIICHCTEMRRL